jgi:hypothetical protein
MGMGMNPYGMPFPDTRQSMHPVGHIFWSGSRRFYAGLQHHLLLPLELVWVVPLICPFVTFTLVEVFRGIPSLNNQKI